MNAPSPDAGAAATGLPSEERPKPRLRSGAEAVANKARGFYREVIGTANAAFTDYDLNKLHSAPRKALQVIASLASMIGAETRIKTGKFHSEAEQAAARKKAEQSRNLFESSVKFLKSSSDPKLKALGFDTDIAFKKYTLQIKLNQIKSYEAHIKKIPPPEDIGVYKVELAKLREEVGINDQGLFVIDLDQKHQGLYGDLIALQQTRQNDPTIKTEANQLEEFILGKNGKGGLIPTGMLELEKNKIKENPIDYLFNIVGSGVEGKQFIKEFVDKFKDRLKPGEQVMLLGAVQQASGLDVTWKKKVETVQTVSIVTIIALLAALFTSSQVNKTQSHAMG